MKKSKKKRKQRVTYKGNAIVSKSKVYTGNIDKDMTSEELAEWNSIYASHKSSSILSGEICGIDSYKLDNTRIVAAVIILYRVKILIPQNMLWENHEDIQESAVRKMLGTEIDFVIHDIDRENGCCVASRVEAMRLKKQRFFDSYPEVGDIVECKITAVRKGLLNVESCGFDMILTPKDLFYSSHSDLRLCFNNGEILKAVIKEIGSTGEPPVISVRDTKPHPYIGIKQRHPINSRRSSVITGKYKGSVFCRLEEDFECLCGYAKDQKDEDFNIGDKVVIAVKKHDDDNKYIFGVILSKRN